jgi:DoxX-like family
MTPAGSGGPMAPPRRSLGALAVGLGIVVAIAAQRLAPIAGPPLYDGVIVEAPYIWLSPPAGHSGGAQGITQTIQVQVGQSPDFGLSTSENPPQIGLFAGAGDLQLPPDTSSIRVSIGPVPVPALPSAGVIAGNQVIGTLEILGGIGLVLPAATGILPWLTPTATVCAAAVMTLAAIFHARRSGEAMNIVSNLFLCAIALLIAFGRFVVSPL